VDPRATQNLLAYIKDQRAATAVLPDDHTILVERNQDEMGAWRVCVHCQLGRAVLQPWAMIIQRNLREAKGLSEVPDPRLFITDDGITIRLGEVGNPSIGHLLGVDPGDVERIVAQETQRSALFTAHFRQCAARALLLPRRDPGKRSPLWQQRLRATQLLGVAASYPDFPIVAEALRECLNDVFDLDPLRQLMSDIANRRVRIVEVETPSPSPFASSLLFGYTGAFMYDYDQPLAERAAAADWVDPDLLAELLGADHTTLIDETAFATVEAQLQRLDPARRAQTMEALWDLLRELGPLTLDECRARCAEAPDLWLEELAAAGRVGWVSCGSQKMAAVSGDLGWLTPPLDQSGVARLVRRWLRHHTVVTPDQVATRYDLAEVAVSDQLNRLADEGVASTGRFIDQPGRQFIEVEVLARVRRLALAKLRASIKPVPQVDYASFLMRWLELDSPGRGMDGLAEAIDQVAGYPLPASMLESVILPGRVADYQPSMLDQLLSTEEVRWTGHGGIGDKDGWVCLWPSDVAVMVPATPISDLTAASRAVAARLANGGAWAIDALAAELVDLTPTQVDQAMWELVWAGQVSSDSFAPVRLLTQGAGVLHRPHVPRARRVMRPLIAPRVAHIGRWFALPHQDEPGSTALVQAMGLELSRYGIVTKGSVLSEAMTPSFFNAYRVLSAMEGQVGVRRGYFIDGLGPAQFALTGAVDRLREKATTGLILMAACDPANPWGAALPWPQSMGHRPTRKAGAIVVLDDGRPVLYLERGAHTLVTFDTERSAVIEALRLVGQWIDARRLDTVTVQRINSESALEAHNWTEVLEQAGFTMTPQGFRRRLAV
jgi:ATP-dependent Lhr-like helicase